MRLLAALDRRPLNRPPVWLMRQAGRYLPEYQELRSRHSFAEAMSTPDLAAEITLQPIRRFPLDGAIVFADIMSPLVAMGVPVDFDPGPKLAPMTLSQIAGLPTPDPEGLRPVTETVSQVHGQVGPDVAVIGFAGGPLTLLAYLTEGGGSQQFPALRSALLGQDPGEALANLAQAMNRYLRAQVEAGAQVVQLFDTWVGLLTPGQFRRWALPAARTVLTDLGVPSVYFAPGANHLLHLFPEVGATGYGVDWRLPLGEAWDRLGREHVIQGNLDPALLLTDPDRVREGTRTLLAEAAGRPGHIVNLGHGVMPGTPVENVTAMVETVASQFAAVPSQPEEAVAR